MDFSQIGSDITQNGNQGGVTWINRFFEEKNFDFRFLSDQMVPSTQNIFLKSLDVSFSVVISWLSYLGLWKNRHFWSDSQFWGLCTGPWGGHFAFFTWTTLAWWPEKFQKMVGTLNFFLESCKERSKLSVDGFGGRGDHLVAQKSNFKIFSSKMTLTHAPPGYLPAWYS